MKQGSFQAGQYREAEQRLSPNCDARPAGTALELVVLHNISLPPGEYQGDCVERFFCNELDFDSHPWFANIRHVKVSSHFYLRRDGGLVQFVPLHCRAWHAGLSSWQGRECCNDFSIGIELQGSDDQPFETIQYQRLKQLLQDLYLACPTLKAVTGHSDIAPGRKTDPGPCFDWSQVPQPGNHP